MRFTSSRLTAGNTISVVSIYYLNTDEVADLYFKIHPSNNTTCSGPILLKL